MIFMPLKMYEVRKLLDFGQPDKLRFYIRRAMKLTKHFSLEVTEWVRQSVLSITENMTFFTFNPTHKHPIHHSASG